MQADLASAQAVTQDAQRESIEARAVGVLVTAAGTLVTNSLASQELAEKDRDELRRQVGEIRASLDAQREANEKTLAGLHQDHIAQVGKLRVDYENEFAALHRQIQGLVLRNTNLAEQLDTEKKRNQVLEGLVQEQSSQIGRQQVEIVKQRDLIRDQQDQINGLQSQLEALTKKGTL